MHSRYTEAAPMDPDRAPNDSVAMTPGSSHPVDLTYALRNVSYVPMSIAL